MATERRFRWLAPTLLLLVWTLLMAVQLFTAVMHSQGHRGQNATRLRELGGKMPMTDYIVWILEGRPSPVWQ